MLSLDKNKILAYLRHHTAWPHARIRFVAAVSVVLSGAVTAVAIGTPQDIAVPATHGVIDELQLPAYQYVETANAPFVHEVAVQSGDTLPSLLARLNVQDADVAGFVSSNAEAKALFRYLKPGVLLVATTTRQGNLYSLSVPRPDGEKTLVISRQNGVLVAGEQTVALEQRVHMTSGTIRSSLFAATDELGLPDSVAVGLAEIFGSEVDFHKDLRRGDRFSVVYEVLYHNAAPVKTGRLLAAEFINDGKRHTAIWQASHNGKGEYFSADGRSLRKGFLRSPLEFSRVSSGFRMRFHPLLKKWRAHNGVDYAAPTGTRVRAAADGTVDFVGVQNGYGKVVVLKHDKGITTAYAHLNGFAQSLKRGSKISQGDIIGFVGSTGWATGPHLHYEFRDNGVHKDPLKVALPGAAPLTGAELAQFKAKADGLLARLALSARYSNVALSNSQSN